MSDVTSSSLLFAVILRLFVEVWGLLHHGAMHHLLPIPWVAASCVTHWISLELVEPSGNAFDLSWKFDATALVQNNFVSISNNRLIRKWFKLTAKELVNSSLCSCWLNGSLLWILQSPFCRESDDCFCPSFDHRLEYYCSRMPSRFQAGTLSDLRLRLQQSLGGKGDSSYLNSFCLMTAWYCSDR